MRFAKSLPVVAVALLSTAVTAHAQTHYSSNITVGVKGGVDFSRVFFNPTVRQGMKTGAVAGVTFRYIEENHFGIIAEANFEQRGWKDNFEGAPYSYSRTVNYIQVPVLAHIYFGRRARFFFNAGPEIGIKIGESTNANFDVNNIASLSGFPYSGRTWSHLTMPVSQKVDFGISAGLGAEFNISRRHSVYLEGRFYYGIGNVLKSGRQDPFNGSNSMSVMATAGYWFRIK